MSKDALPQELQSIFRDVLDQPALVLTRESNAASVEDWDSLAHINLLTTIERAFKIKFALGDVQGLKNVGDMVDLLERKLSTR